MRTFAYMLAASVLGFGCVVDGGADVSSSDDALAEGSAEAKAALHFLNYGDSTYGVLRNDVGLTAAAARNIAEYRWGAEWNATTAPSGSDSDAAADDDLFDSLAELDLVTQVGPATMEKLGGYAVAHGWLETHVVEGVGMTSAEAERVVALANTAAENTLRDDIELAPKSVQGILEGRPFATVEGVGQAWYVGQYAMGKLFEYVVTHDGNESAAEKPIPYVLQWINDYRGTGEVSRLNLLQDGTYEATVAGAAEKGFFYGPKACVSPIPLTLVSTTGVEWSADLTLYSGESAEVARGDYSGSLAATLPTDGEDMCMEGGGLYHDDDATSDCLYCSCEGGDWIPAMGGCVFTLSAERLEAITNEVKVVVGNGDWTQGVLPAGKKYFVAALPGATSQTSIYTAYIPIDGPEEGAPWVDPNTVDGVWIEREHTDESDGITSTSAMPIGVPL